MPHLTHITQSEESEIALEFAESIRAGFPSPAADHTPKQRNKKVQRPVEFLPTGADRTTLSKETEKVQRPVDFLEMLSFEAARRGDLSVATSRRAHGVGVAAAE